MFLDFVKPIRKGVLNLAGQTKPFDETSMSHDALAALGNARASRRDFLRGAGVMIVGFRMAGKLDAEKR